MESTVLKRLAPGGSGGHRRGSAACVSILLGCAVAMITRGLALELAGDVFPGVGLPVSVAVGAMLALAIGIRVPQSFAMWLCSIPWRRFVHRGKTPPLSDLVISSGTVDRSLYWVTLSVIALVSGVFTILMPLTTRLALGSAAWVHARFVWSDVSLMVLHTLTVFVAGFVPLASLGLSISCVHHVSCRFGQWESRATAWALLGIAGGVLLSSSISIFTSRSELLLPAASIPILLVALICAGSNAGVPESESADVDSDVAALPIWPDRWPMLLRAGIVLVGSSAVCALGVWVCYVDQLSGSVEQAVVVMFGAMGVGALAGSRAKQSGLRSIGGFGAACAFAGVILASIVIYLTSVSSRLETVDVLVLAGISVGMLGFAMAYGHQTLLHRVASRSSVGATILGRLLAVGAIVIWMVMAVSGRLMVPAVTLTPLALLMLILGGALIFYEPSYSRRTRRVRLCLVVVSTAAVLAFVLRPAGGAQSWQRREDTSNSRVVNVASDSGQISVGGAHDR